MNTGNSAYNVKHNKPEATPQTDVKAKENEKRKMLPCELPFRTGISRFVQTRL